jgi:hypothetical protein
LLGNIEFDEQILIDVIGCYMGWWQHKKQHKPHSQNRFRSVTRTTLYILRVAMRRTGSGFG